jgi:membrane protein required for beta-lactamase induction
MAIRLLVVLIALGLLHVAPQLASWRGDGLFRRWIRQLSDTSGAGRVVLALLPPVVLCAVLAWLFGHTVLGELPQLLFGLVVLLYCFGPREFERGPGFLGAAAQADVLIDIEAGDGYAEEHSDPLGELRRLRGALLRALLAWLSVVALLVIGSWVS